METCRNAAQNSLETCLWYATALRGMLQQLLQTMLKVDGNDVVQHYIGVCLQTSKLITRHKTVNKTALGGRSASTISCGAAASRKSLPANVAK
jgi:hypothetical protein